MIKNISFFLLTSFVLISCYDKKFDSNTWKNDDPVTYSERNKMVNDLIDSHIINDKNRSEIIKILGKQDWMDTTLTGKVMQLCYAVRLSYGFDIDPKYSTSLDIKIDTITNRSKEIKYVKSKDQRDFLEKLLTE